MPVRRGSTSGLEFNDLYTRVFPNRQIAPRGVRCRCAPVRAERTRQKGSVSGGALLCRPVADNDATQGGTVMTDENAMELALHEARSADPPRRRPGRRNRLR